MTDAHRDLIVLAVQGPRSDEVLIAAGLPAGHDYMSFVEADVDIDGHSDHVIVCRTGYTGERGYELIAANGVALGLWDRLMAAGADESLTVRPRARDTLRTEMCYPLHGQDISLDTTPNEARLGWAVGWKKDAFWGRDVLVKEKAEGPKRILRGVVATGRAIPRPHMRVTLTADVVLGEITSGTFSPTLKKGVGLALLSSVVNPEAEVGVDVRGRREIFQLTPPPFVPAKVREA